jgi:hypothetical protein
VRAGGPNWLSGTGQLHRSAGGRGSGVMLFHVSEEAGIERFEPLPQTAPAH